VAKAASEGCGISQIFDDFTVVQLIDDTGTLVDDGNGRRWDNQRLQCIEAGGGVEWGKWAEKKGKKGASKRRITG
jgi:hypothetical protein